MKLIYVPVEPYQERWTEFVSRKYGMFESKLIELNIPFVTVRPHERLSQIQHGEVLDPIKRSSWSFEQITRIISGLSSGAISSDDVIYFEDFWTPGIEQIPYTCDVLRKRRPKMYAFCHAQSVDPNDFTASMNWIRPFENAIVNVLDGVFCAAPELALLMKGGWTLSDERKLHATGTVFNRTTLTDMFKPCTLNIRGNKVVYSSRWDREKDPGFFMTLAEEVLKERKDIEFVVCTGANELRSNDPVLVNQARYMDHMYERFIIKEALSKRSYYAILAGAKVQFNCAHQDFVSYVLLEGATFGCAPLYPNYLTFPAALNYNMDHLYQKGSISSAKEKLYKLLERPEQDYSWVTQKYEGSVARMVHIMGFHIADECKVAAGCF